MDKRDALRYRIAPLEMTSSEFRKAGRQLVERIAEFPRQHAASSQRRSAPGYERGPRQERTTSAISPDLDAKRWAYTRAARVKTEGIGNDQGIGGNRKGTRLRQAERRQLSRIDAERALPILGIRRVAGSKAHAPLPGEPLGRQSMGAGNIREGAGVFGDIR